MTSDETPNPTHAPWSLSFGHSLIIGSLFHWALLMTIRIGNSHFGPERGCVASNSRSMPGLLSGAAVRELLRLVVDTAALRQNENCWIRIDAPHASVIFTS